MTLTNLPGKYRILEKLAFKNRSNGFPLRDIEALLQDLDKAMDVLKDIEANSDCPRTRYCAAAVIKEITGGE